MQKLRSLCYFPCGVRSNELRKRQRRKLVERKLQIEEKMRQIYSAKVGLRTPPTLLLKLVGGTATPLISFAECGVRSAE
jgi:hypothetical protein